MKCREVGPFSHSPEAFEANCIWVLAGHSFTRLAAALNSSQHWKAWRPWLKVQRQLTTNLPWEARALQSVVAHTSLTRWTMNSSRGWTALGRRGKRMKGSGGWSDFMFLCLVAQSICSSEVNEARVKVLFSSFKSFMSSFDCVFGLELDEFPIQASLKWTLCLLWRLYLGLLHWIEISTSLYYSSTNIHCLCFTLLYRIWT